MTAKQIQDIVCNDSRWRGFCNNITTQDGQAHYADDLYQEFILILLEYSPEKLEGIYIKGKHVLDFWVMSTIRRQWYSKTSPFFKKYKLKVYDLDAQRELSENERNKVAECIQEKFLEFRRDRPFTKHFDDGGLYDLLFDWYLEDGSLRKLSKRLNIPHPTLAVYIRQYKAMIAEALKECEEC